MLLINDPLSIKAYQFLVCGWHRCLLMYDGGNLCGTYQFVMILNVLISDYLFELSLWQGMLGTFMTEKKHAVGIQIGVTQSVLLYVVSLTIKTYHG